MKFWSDRRFFMLFREMRHFLQLFAEKFTQTTKHGSFLENVAIFRLIDDFLGFFMKSGTFFNFLPKSSTKRRDVLVSSKKCRHLAKSTIFHAFSGIRHVLKPFVEKLTQTPKHSSVDREVPRFCQINDFSCFLAK